MGVLQGLVSHGGYLYAAWKGEPDDDRIFYSRWNGSGKWAPASPMASGTVGGNTSAGPSLGVFGGSLYAAWKGEWSDPRLFFAKYNDANWENQKQIPNAYSDVGPALCSFSSTQLIAAWKNFDQNLYFAIYDGSNWTAPSQIAGVASSVGPSLATYGGKLYAVWKGEGSDESLWYASYDGKTWSGQTPGSSQTQIPGVGSSVGVSLASVGNKLYAVWKGEGSDESLWYAYYDGTTWSGQTPGSSQTQISGVGSSVGAAIAEFKGNLYGMCKGKDADTSLYTAEFSSNSWLGWSNAIPGNTGPDTDTTLLQLPGPLTPGLPGSSNYWFVDSGGREKHLTGASVTLLVTADIVPSPSSTQAGGYQNYSFQMNCWSQPPSPSSSPTSYVWQQYGFRVANGLFFFWVNAFDINNNQQVSWDSRPKYEYNISKNILPKGWQFTVNLATDATSGHVTGVSFTLANSENAILLATPTLELINLTSSAGSSPNAGDEAKIDSFMTVLVGENTVGGQIVNFVSGQGIFLVEATNNLAVTNVEPPLDPTNFLGTNENSNITYSSLPASYPNGEFYQFFGVPPV